MPVFHRVYGLCLSSPMALPGLHLLSDWQDPVDVQIHLKERNLPQSTSDSLAEPVYKSADSDELGNPVLRISELAGGKYLIMSYSDGARFILREDGGEIYADWPENLALEDACVYIAGPVLGFLLHLRGIVPLHASAVSMNDRAIAFVGPAGAGKSTTAAAFAQYGGRVISDDVVPIIEREGRLLVSPGYPRVNLWDESARVLFSADEKLPLITPNWNKRFMPLDLHNQFEERDLALGAIYVLRNREHGLDKPVIEEVTGNAAFIALAGNTYMTRMLRPAMRDREFSLLGRIATRMPMRVVRVAADPNKLPLLFEAIKTDVKYVIGSDHIGDAGARKN